MVAHLKERLRQFRRGRSQNADLAVLRRTILIATTTHKPQSFLVEHRLTGATWSYLCVFTTLLIASCGDGNPNTCGVEPWDYRFGDRCTIAVSDAGEVQSTPSMLRLSPSTDGAPVTGSITIIGYDQRKLESDGLAAVPADGSFVDISIAGRAGTSNGVLIVQEECPLPLEISPAPDAELCVVQTPTNLRCILDPTGVTEIVASTTRTYASVETCEIWVQSGKNLDHTVVSVSHDPADLDLAIHFGGSDDGCGDTMNPCQGNGGRLPQEVCTTGIEECAALNANASFYLAIDHEGERTPTGDLKFINLMAIAQQYPTRPIAFSSKPDCSIELPRGFIDRYGQSDTIYLCTGGQSGNYEILATSITDDLSDSIFVSFPAVPAKLTLSPGELGSDSTPSYYKLDVEDCGGEVLQEELDVTTPEKTTRVTSGTYFPVPFGSTEISVSFPNWSRTCNISLTTP